MKKIQCKIQTLGVKIAFRVQIDLEVFILVQMYTCSLNDKDIKSAFRK